MDFVGDRGVSLGGQFPVLWVTLTKLSAHLCPERLGALLDVIDLKAVWVGSSQSLYSAGAVPLAAMLLIKLKIDYALNLFGFRVKIKVCLANRGGFSAGVGCVVNCISETVRTFSTGLTRPRSTNKTNVVINKLVKPKTAFFVL